MINGMRPPTLDNYVNRLKLNTKLLKDHPEQKELLERKIEENKKDIIEFLLNGK
jgi:hypothetical protein